MIEQEDNFNEFLKQKVEESTFEFDESYWLKAEKMIEKSETVKKPFWLGFGSGVLSVLFLGIIGTWAWVQLNSNESTITPMANNKQTIIDSDQNSDNNGNSETLNTKTEDNIHESVTSLVSNTAKQPINHLSTPVASHSKKSEKVLLASRQNTSSIFGSKVSGTDNSSTISNVNALNSIEPVVNREYSDNYNNTSIILENSDNQAQPADDKILETSISGNQLGSNKDIDHNVATACDNSLNSNWMFDVLGGLSDSRGFEGNALSDSKIGFGYYVGFRAAYKVDNTWFVAAQPLVYTRGAINTSIQTKRVDYNFGSISDEFIVKNKEMMLAELPVVIGYRLNRHQISIGGGLEYLINVKSDVKDFGTDTYNTNQWGYVSGFNRVGAVGVFSYAFNIYQDFWLNMMVQKGFTDFTQSAYFTNESKDKNLNLRIGLQYRLLNQKRKIK